MVCAAGQTRSASLVRPGERTPAAINPLCRNTVGAQSRANRLCWFPRGRLCEGPVHMDSDVAGGVSPFR